MTANANHQDVGEQMGTGASLIGSLISLKHTEEVLG